ncbi:MAG: DUF4402 domain-containing protein [Bacteroidales bacterium]|jgi:hypothetical protein|nr:DUF4402 domain-containing protein [Bacteroidales bacterium]
MNKKGGILSFRERIILLVTVSLLGGAFSAVNGQVLPPRPIIVTVNHAQPLAFGAFSPGLNGGTLTVRPDGSRSSTGDVVRFGMGFIFTPAMFYIRANPGTVITMLVNPPVTLTGSGGGTLSLQIGSTLPAMPFVTSVPWQQQTTLLVGGTLTIGDIVANPPGNYTGTFAITLVQQ